MNHMFSLAKNMRKVRGRGAPLLGRKCGKDLVWVLKLLK